LAQQSKLVLRAVRQIEAATPPSARAAKRSDVVEEGRPTPLTRRAEDHWETGAHGSARISAAPPGGEVVEVVLEVTVSGRAQLRSGDVEQRRVAPGAIQERL